MASQPPIVVGISGASGAPIAVRLLRWLKAARVPTAVVISAAGRRVLRAESGVDPAEVERLGTRAYADDDISAPIASGTQRTRGMAIVPCSSTTVARIALGFGDSLIARAAHVHLKERRPLVVVPRETPLSTVLLRNLTTVSELGVVVLPPMPAYYLRPERVDQVTDYLTGKILDQFGLPHRLYRPWAGGSG